jgi:putative transposase
MNLDRTSFITTVTWQRTPLFRSQPKAELMMDVLLHYREQMRYVLHEFVIMPDHLHLLLTPGADISLERALQLIKGGFSYRFGKAKRGLVWQESFTNHRVRDRHDYERHAEYIRMNPVRACLVKGRRCIRIRRRAPDSKERSEKEQRASKAVRFKAAIS